MSQPLRIATFNLENLDDVPGAKPSLDERIAVMRPQLLRLRADVLCLQEVHGQKPPGQPRQLLALQALLARTPYANFCIAHTVTANKEAFDKRNLVIVSRFPLSDVQQHRNDLIRSLRYQKVTADPPEETPKDITFERPIFCATVTVSPSFVFHLINVHLKSRIPTAIQGQQTDQYTWKTSSGWAEGFFLSSLKRVGQALETRIYVDQIFDQDGAARIVICGDFNAHPDEVPVEAISGRIENTGNAALASRVLTPCENTVPETARFTYLHQGQKRLLDHMLISQSMLPHYRKAEIHNEMLHDETLAFATDTKFPESDHAPFAAEFEVPGD
jgi:endonuclease/exonuclease/phosphatase family metal-dependent hydrolase